MEVSVKSSVVKDETEIFFIHRNFKLAGKLKIRELLIGVPALRGSPFFMNTK